MERILIYQDKAAVDSWKEQRDVQNQEIMELGKMLKEDNIDLDQETFIQFVKKGSEFIWALLEKELEANAKKAGITSRIGKKNLKIGINERSKEYKPIHAKILAGFPKCQNTAEGITIAQGKSILTKMELEQKRETLSIFIETDDQHQLWKLLQDSCKLLNDLEKFVSKRQELRSIFAGGDPKNLTDYIDWKKNPKVGITEIPTTGGMIFVPNPDAIKDLQ